MTLISLRNKQQSFQNTGRLDFECSRVDGSSLSQKFKNFFIVLLTLLSVLGKPSLIYIIESLVFEFLIDLSDA